MDSNIPKIPWRIQDSNKGTYGKILNIAGSKYMPGAAYLSSISALKVGAGYVELVSCEKTLSTVAKLAPEIVLSSVKNLPEKIKNADIISIGCGLSTSNEAVKLLINTLKLRKNQPLIIDADGLNILSQLDFLFDGNTALTPHPKEASRLLNCELNDILDDLKGSAKAISKKYNCVTVLKTHNTIVTDGNNVYINKTGCSALAKAGSGDVLCGIIAGIAAQSIKIYEAAKLGVYLHGLAGDIAAEDLSEYSVLASDLIRYIPCAIKNYAK